MAQAESIIVRNSAQRNSDWNPHRVVFINRTFFIKNTSADKIYQFHLNIDNSSLETLDLAFFIIFCSPSHIHFKTATSMFLA